jgi:hypothetical protein
MGILRIAVRLLIHSGAVAGGLVAILVNSSLASACTLENAYGVSGHWFGGGQQTTPSLPVTAKATMNAYTPSPVFSSSSIWIMLADSSGAHYAQVGERRVPSVSANSFIFWQYMTDGYGVVNQNFPNTAPGGNWVYEVDTSSASPCFFWGANSQCGGTNITWQPTMIESFNEVTNYKNWSQCSTTLCTQGCSQGDHAFGDTSHIFHVYNVQWAYRGAQGFANANLSYQGQGSQLNGNYPSTDYQIVGGDSYNWTIYDSRCSN